MNSYKSLLKKTTALTAVILLASCSIEPAPITDWEVANRVDNDIKEMFGNQRTDIIAKPLTMYDAMARAVKFNLNSRLKMMESVLAAKKLDVTSLDMLPQITASAGYVGRNEYEAIVSKQMKSGVKSPATAYSSKSHGIGSLQASWNLLDFGVGYYRAKQNANDILIAQENNRKLTQVLLQDVRYAFWRAITAERLVPEIDDLTEEATYVLEELKTIDNINSDNVLLGYQMSLMEALHDLSEMKTELLRAKDELSALMNIKPGTRYRLVGPEEGNFTLPDIHYNLDKLEWLALMNRPELRKKDYDLQNVRLEAKKNLLRLFPSLNLSVSGNHSTDSYLDHKSWVEAAAQLGFNLINIAGLSKTSTQNEVAEATENLERQNIAMSILTQTHLGWNQYQGLKETYLLSAEISKVAEEIALRSSEENSKEQNISSKSIMVLDASRALFAKLRMMMNFAKLQDATGNVFVTLGLDPIPQDAKFKDVNTISKMLERVMANWDLGKLTGADFNKLPPVPTRRPPIYLNVEIPLKTVIEDSRFILTVPPTAFNRAKLGKDVVYTASMFNGKPLPSWMYFDGKTITLSGRPPAMSEGVYEVKILAKNKKKLSAYILLTIRVVRGYQTVLDVRGAEKDSRVTVIQKCQMDESCEDNKNVRQIDAFPEKIKVMPLVNTKKKE